jgi:MAP kinase interacting serine/threonine kinase
VTERLDGGPLLDHIQSSKIFTERQASLVTRDIASALSFLHSQGITHRDLKPQNVLCVYKDQPSPAKLADFGLGTKTSDTSRTPPLCDPVGTPEFMPPEVAEAISLGERCSFDRACDLWSLGVCVYIMLSGKPPFSGDCGADCGWKRGLHCENCAENLLDQIQDCAVRFKGREWRRVSGAAKDLIARMLVKESQRISADMVLRHPWLSQNAPATPLSTPDLLRQWSHSEDLESFAAAANIQQRKNMGEDEFFSPATLSDPTASAIYARRCSSRNLATSFTTIQNQNLEEICTPKFSSLLPAPKTVDIKPPQKVSIGFDL